MMIPEDNLLNSLNSLSSSGESSPIDNNRNEETENCPQDDIVKKLTTQRQQQGKQADDLANTIDDIKQKKFYEDL